jgi:hypothetical protein
MSDKEILKLIVKYYKETKYKVSEKELTKEFNNKEFKSPEIQRDFISSKLNIFA